MSLISIRFVLFLVVAVILYYSAPLEKRWMFLLIISFAFYLISSPKAILLIIFTILTSFLLSCKMDENNVQCEEQINGVVQNIGCDSKKKSVLRDETRKKNRVFLIIALVINFGILFLLKYVKPVLFSSIGIPLGISYYTFQSMGYVIDIYRNKHRAEKNVLKYSLFILFFPQLMQGPISRHSDISEQLLSGKKFSMDMVWKGIELIVWGIFKKIVIGDRLYIITNNVFSNINMYDGCFIWVATFFSMIELYADFSGGIDIARGGSELFGITLPENFLRPFFAKSLNEFWRRWHITLNNWWRDYIFYPVTLTKAFSKLGKKAKNVLGSNVGRKIPVVCALIFVRMVNSIWHGVTQCSFVSGLYYGILLAASFLLDDFFRAVNKKLSINTECFTWKLFQCIRTFILISLPRMVSYSNTLSDGWGVIKKAFSYNPWILFDGSLYELGVSGPQFRVTIYCILFMGVISWMQEKGIRIRDCIAKQNVIARGMIYIAFIYFILIFGVYGSGYNSASFAYAQF